MGKLGSWFWKWTKRLRYAILACVVVAIGAAALVPWRRVFRSFTRAPRPASAASWHDHPAPEPAPFAASGAPGRFVERVDVSTFQRGNVHAHSKKSDGDETPEEVYAWYRDHGYNFLALSDHNVLVDPANYRQLERPDFVLVPAEEITMEDRDGVPVHVNAICHRSQIGGATQPTVADALRWGIAKIADQRAIALVNHPNLAKAISPDDLVAAKGAQLLEIWSGLPDVRSEGGPRRPSQEALWDVALSRGLDLGGVAVDDLHHLSTPPDNTKRSGPGRGWIEVFAERAAVADICEAIRSRRFFASSGVRLARVRVDGEVIEVSARPPARLVEFFGLHGALLERQRFDAGGNAYHLRGGEGYVRARVTGPEGARAWTQAYRVTTKP
jgi:hypothetical protein